MTVLEVIQKSTDFLAKKGVESPRLQVEHLLAHVLGLPRLQLYLKFDRVLTEPELERLRELVKRRGTREPLQHVLGTACFHGRDFRVNRHVLVPRPETEVLAECAWTFLQARGADAMALDFGTGSGCLAITVAAMCSASTVHALDISPEALAVAQENATNLKAAERMIFHQGDGFAALPSGLTFDLIVSNPPYIPTAEIATLEPEVKTFDPSLALDGGADGLDFYRRLAAEARPWLRPGGQLMAEFGDGQAEAIRTIFTAAGWTVSAVEADLSGRLRYFVAG